MLFNTIKQKRPSVKLPVLQIKIGICAKSRGNYFIVLTDFAKNYYFKKDTVFYCALDEVGNRPRLKLMVIGNLFYFLRGVKVFQRVCYCNIKA
jgi:hypothetical protein